MRHRLRERPKAAAGSARRRGRRSCVAASREGSAPGALLPELSELLSVEEAAGTWWEDERPEETSLSDLLQQLVSADYPGEEASAPGPPGSHVTPDALHPAAARGRGNKNAEAARLNRLRKKEYVSGLEGTVARLSDDNARLQQERRALGERVRELEAEARYLRAVLANDSALSQLLSRLTGLGGVRMSTSLFRDPSVKPDDHDYALPGVTGEEEEGPAPSGGVCLHVDKEKVSVEFCPACARSAKSAAKM